MKIVCLSDTHTMGAQIQVPDGDVLVHSGDHTMNGRRAQIEKAMRWLSGLPHRHKVIIAGNHDFLFQEKKVIQRWLKRYHKNVHYLEDSWIEIDGVRFYGTPWQPWFHNWAFNLPHPSDPLARVTAKNVFDQIPAGTDVLLTHSPPFSILDRTLQENDWDDRKGSEELLYRVAQVRPKLHVFGHIHESYGQLQKYGIHFVNASICTRKYEPINTPIVVEI